MALATSGLVAATDVPAYISARAANSLISENRPTRIQADTLLVLNRLLDELLLLILSSARSLATDRIKTDGMLKVLNNNLLAKDAVLEAELELRSYLDGKRAEGAKVPLGLLATSRLDGTESFPVKSAYNALRIRCQYFSTLGDREDASAVTDQNIMSSDGRPIATITPGVAIYVTALLEYVGEHILQNVARVIERDNSDEASLYDLKAAITEDELLAGLFGKMAIREEVKRRIDMSQSRRTRRLNGSGPSDDLVTGGKAEARAVKPWQVPTEHELDEAAAPARFSARRASVQPGARIARPDIQHDRASFSGQSFNASHADQSDTTTASARSPSTTATSASGSGSFAGTIPGESHPGMSRRQSSDKGWTGVFGQMKRRNSQRQSSEVTSGTFGKTLSPPQAAMPSNESALEPEDDFEALMLSGQTMKVSLTPNRLRTIEVAKQDSEAKKNARRRPGTLNSPLRDEFAASGLGAAASAAPSPVRSFSGHSTEAHSIESVDPTGKGARRPGSRGSLQAPSSWTAPMDRRMSSQPPSSYRSPSPALVSAGQTGHSHAEEDADVVDPPSKASRKLQPRDSKVDRGPNSQDMVDFLRSAPAHDGASSHGSLRLSESESDGSRKVGVSNRVRNLFGRKASANGKDLPPLMPRYSVSSAREEAQGSPGYISPTSASSVASHADQPSSSAASGSIGRRTTINQQDLALATETSRIGTAGTAQQEAPSPRRSVGSPVQVTISNAVTTGVGAGAAGVAIGSAGGPASDRRSSPTAAAAAAATATSTPPIAVRTNSQGTFEERRSLSGRNGQTNAGVVGLYEEPKQRPRTPPSPRTRPRQDDLPSRKVPWGYNRFSTSSYQHGDSMGTPTSDKRRSIGYQSSGGHGGPSHRAARGSVENGDTPSSTLTDEGPTGPVGGRTPTLYYTTNGRRGSGAQSSLAASRDSSSIAAHQRPAANVAMVLAELERLMRDCTSADECRAVVLRAMAGDASASSPAWPNGGGVDVPDEGSSVHGAHTAGPPAQTAAFGIGTTEGLCTAPGPASAATRATPVDPVAEVQTRTETASPDGRERSRPPTSLEECELNSVVAWLLAGEEAPVVPTDWNGAVEQEGGGRGARGGSFDSQASRKEVGEGPYGRGRRAGYEGSVVSLVSNYRDAVEGEV